MKELNISAAGPSSTEGKKYLHAGLVTSISSLAGESQDWPAGATG